MMVLHVAATAHVAFAAPVSRLVQLLTVGSEQVVVLRLWASDNTQVDTQQQLRCTSISVRC
jgi:hypothetical protein